MTKLINYRTYNLDRSAKPDGEATKVTPIDRRSVFGNPFVISKRCNRKAVINLYEEYFYKRMRKDKEFKEAIESLKGKTLGCWCTPLPCHGDVIIEYLNGLETEGLE